MRRRRPTHFELWALLNYILLIMPPKFDLALLGINPKNIETVRKFWEEYCDGLTYKECKKKVRELIPSAKEYTYIIEEEKKFIIDQARSYFREKYGEDKLYILYKTINDEEHEDYPALYEYVTAKYGCIDVGSEKITLFPLQITDDIEAYINNFIELLGFWYIEKLSDLADDRPMIGIVSNTPQGKVLFCYTSDEERPVGYPLTATQKIGVVSWRKKAVAIIL